MTLPARITGEPAHLIDMASGHDPGTLAWPEHVRAAARAVGVDLR